MARDFNKQKEGGHPALGLKEDAGFVTFSGTGSTVTLTTRLKKIKHVQFHAETITPGSLEQFYISTPAISDFWYSVPGSGDIIITRAALPIRIEGVAGDGAIVSDDVIEAPIGICPVAGAVTALWWYNTILSGGSPLMNVGKVPGGGVGSADGEFFVDAADDATSSHVPPASSVGEDIFALTDSGTYAGGSRVVVADDLITVGTEGGTGTPSPTGIFLSMEVTPTLTSGLNLFYRFLGL